VPGSQVCDVWGRGCYSPGIERGGRWEGLQRAGRSVHGRRRGKREVLSWGRAAFGGCRIWGRRRGELSQAMAARFRKWFQLKPLKSMLRSRYTQNRSEATDPPPQERGRILPPGAPNPKSQILSLLITYFAEELQMYSKIDSTINMCVDIK
jgi:hypothetical protein